MNKKETIAYRTRAEIVKAMAHPSRLFIMDQLAAGERCVNELREMIGDDISTISKHLSVLKKAGIIIDRKEGTKVYYSLKVPCIMNFMSCVETLLRENAEERLSCL